MPGAYAHLTVVVLLNNYKAMRALLKEIPKIHIAHLLLNNKFFELGAVSPDYPYLHLANAASQQWADVMHYEKTGDKLKAGALLVRQLPEQSKYKALAWLLGYASHVIADAVVHPVVELRVGPYAQNKTEHRVCEMHQDVFIYRVQDVGEIAKDNFLRDGIATCSSEQGKDYLDQTIAQVWDSILRDTAPLEYEQNPPQFDSWHSGFQWVLKAGGAGKLLAFARHVAADLGLVYPEEPDNSYTEDLKTPNGKNMPYEMVFGKALEQVGRFWNILAQAGLLGNEGGLKEIRNWNLDTGYDENGRLSFWE